MALSKVQIYNLALSRIGTKSSVSDVDENSEEAVRLSAIYDHVRDTVLRDHAWPFATVYKALAITGETDSLWIYQYRYPSDCLNFLSILPTSWLSDSSGAGLIFDESNTMINSPYISPPKIPFEVAVTSTGTQRVVLTNEPDAVAKYVVRVTNEQLFDHLFTDAFAYKLAAEASPSLTGSDTKTQALIAAYNGSLLVAKAAANNENEALRAQQPESVRARL